MGVCERIKDEVSITDYARYMGFTLLKKGNYYTMKEHDSVMMIAITRISRCMPA